MCCAICSCAALWRGRVAGCSRCLACICRCLAMAGLPCSLQCCATASPFCRLPAWPVGIGPLLFCLCRMPCCDRVYTSLPVVAGGLDSKMHGGCLGAVRSPFMCRGHAAGPVCRHVWLRSCVSPANRGTFDGGLRLVGLFLFRRLPDMLIGVGVCLSPGLGLCLWPLWRLWCSLARGPASSGLHAALCRWRHGVAFLIAHVYGLELEVALVYVTHVVHAGAFFYVQLFQLQVFFLGFLS